ncbi:MAG: IS110 family transposase [Isosphaeraceae bacterium]
MEILCDRCAGIDVHKRTVVVSARWVGPDAQPVSEVRTYGTMTAELLELADWLVGLGIERVAMESTGVYWKPVYHLLEGRLEVLLVNASHIKNVPGRKTDVNDAGWIAQLLAHGLLRASFIPPAPIRHLRDLTRQRATLVQDRARVANRIQKLLEDCNLKLGDVASDVLGKSGRSILEAIAGGASDPDFLAEKALGRLREKIPALRRALTGTVTDHHRFLLRSLLDQIAFFDAHIERFDSRVIQVMEPPAAEATATSPAEEPLTPPAEGPPTSPAEGPLTSPAVVLSVAEAVERLMTIPGVGRRAAEVIIAEIGPDMTVFPDAGHLSSWAGMCPGNHQSAGKRIKGRTTKGSQWLRTTLIQVAWSASHTKATVLRQCYQCWSRRLGKKRALLALGHKILRIVYHILNDRTIYVESLGASPTA